ncbi:MAG TPA: hypothetical protein VMW35_09655 [Myxococcota bacterium]|jgi:hypothetical protein|nr:hypothetical protein [Myxococcota bacterium]
MRVILFGLVGAWAGLVLAGGARADCVADCSAKYQDAMAACRTAHPDSDTANLEPLQSCMDEAQEAYGSCVDRCDTSSME